MSVPNLNDFINGCDNWWDGTWKYCCDAHDIAYTQGGDLLSRLAADFNLGACVWNESPVNGVLMCLGTAAFGGLFYRFNWKWLDGRNIWECIFTRKQLTMTPEENFKKVAPTYMKRAMLDFGFSEEDAAAVFGNAGHESLGFTKLQEMKPTVKGSRGGWGWFQWTGPRRKEFEAYTERNKLDPSAHETNYKFLFVELNGTEKKAVAATKNAVGLEAKTKAFENTFERSGVKHYDKRYNWARIALQALRDEAAVVVPEVPEKSLTVAPTPLEINWWAVGGVVAVIAVAIASFTLPIFGA